MQATLWVKSHSEAPDIEDYPVEIKDNKCEARFSDDPEDSFGYKCGGKIRWEKEKTRWGIGGNCQSCGAGYLREGE